MPFCDLHPHSFASSLPSRTVLLAMASPVHGSTMKRKASNASQAQDKKLKGEAVKRESDGAEEEAGIEVNPGRVRMLREGDGGKGPVVYWMCRDHRSRDNWALLYAAQHSQKNGSPLAVAFNLVDEFLEAKARHFGFMLRGLRIVQLNLAKLGIPFFLFQGEPKENIPEFLKRCNASTLVMDFSPLRIGRIWREEICASVNASVSVYEVDAHNVVPVWLASDKQEYSARTIRGKIQRQLPEFLVDYPAMKGPQTPWNAEAPQIIEWDALINEVTRKGADVPEIQWCEPGEDAALEVLVGAKNGFLTVRIKNYADDRNDPAKPSGLSGLSPYLHYGHISAQRCALEAHKYRKLNTKAIDAFLEELIIRRELADNFCYYQPYYDSIKGASEWARKTLTEHALDKREHIYLREELEKGKTHDELWNASQLEMVHTGKMHGFMRMYWAKKILEWTRSPEEALAISIYLNDKFELDGRDPNGYVGCMWSICGIHDQGWQERPIFGKIRYMNYNGCKRKFNVDGYIQYVRRLVVQLRKTSKQETKFGPSSTATKEASL